MKLLYKSIDSYPRYYKILAVLVLFIIFYKFGYILGKFIANINL